MINTLVEKLTAAEALAAGLDRAIKRGETTINGTYKIDTEYISNPTFKQSNFTFKDSVGNLRVGKFTNDKELIKFLAFLKA